MLGFSEFGEQPVDFCGFERHIDLDGGVAGNGSGDSCAANFGILDLGRFFSAAQDLFQHEFEFAAFQADWRGFYGERARAEGLGLEAVALKFLGDGGEGDHLRGKKLEEYGHEQALTLDGLDFALAHDFFKKDTLVGDVLVDDPEAFFVGGEDE